MFSDILKYDDIISTNVKNITYQKSHINVISLLNVVMLRDVWIALGDGNVILYLKVISLL